MQMTLQAPSPLTLRVRDFNHFAFLLTQLEAARRRGRGNDGTTGIGRQEDPKSSSVVAVAGEEG